MPPAWYLDAARVAIIEETIKKEQKIQREHLEAGVASGRIAAYCPPPAPVCVSVRDAVGLPPFARSVRRAAAEQQQQQQQQQEEGDRQHLAASSTTAATAEEISRLMWACNPGYVDRDGPRLGSVTHQDYSLGADAAEFMRAGGAPDPRHRRRRDGFTLYVEQAIRAGHRLGRRDGAASGVGVGGKGGKK